VVKRLTVVPAQAELSPLAAGRPETTVTVRAETDGVAAPGLQVVRVTVQACTERGDDVAPGTAHFHLKLRN
jgi:hypothetical protein